MNDRAKNKQVAQGAEALDEVRALATLDPKNFLTDYWPADDVAIDNAPDKTAAGGVRLYWHIEKGSVLHGLYQGTEVLKMPTFDKSDVEERAFLVFKIKAPVGYKGSKPYGVLVRRPRSQTTEVAGEGKIVYVGVRQQLSKLLFLSAFDFQTHMGIRASSQETTSRNFKLWMFDFHYGKTDIPSLDKTPASDEIAAMFEFVDRGYYAATEIFQMALPPGIQARFEKKFGLKQEVPALPAGLDMKLIEAIASAVLAQQKALPATIEARAEPPIETIAVAVGPPVQKAIAPNAGTAG